MFNLKKATIYLFSCAVVFFFSACEDDVLQNQQMASRTTTTANAQELDEEIDNSNGQPVPYPTIIKQVFIPGNSLFAEMKCIAWNITWPPYAAGMDVNKIPTVFRTSNGALNSVNMLNHSDEQNTYKADFSLYLNGKIEAAIMMWEELQHRELSEMEDVKFFKTSYPASTINDWVKKRPQRFRIHYPEGAVDARSEITYQAGDIILFHMQQEDLYGGIRIVSMNPRVIEVYLAVPNN